MVSLRKVEELHSSTKSHPKVYRGVLSPAQRQLMADIYKDAGLRQVKPSARRFDTIRKAWL